MNIAEFKGEKTVKSLAKRLLAEPTKDTPKTTQAEMEAALLRLNPQLNQIGDLEKGTPIVVPEEFNLAADESVNALHGATEELLQQSKDALAKIRTMLEEHTAYYAERSESVATWLKSDGAKELLRSNPELKEAFSDAARAAKTVPKEQAAAIAAEQKALDKVQSQLASFRVK